MFLPLVIDSTSILGLVALAQAITLIIFLVIFYSKNNECWLLVALLSSMVIAIGHDIFLYSRLAQFVPQIIGFGPFSTYLVGPILLLITLRLLWPTRRFQWYEILHFMPFGLHFILRFSHYTGDAKAKLAFLQHYYQIESKDSQPLAFTAETFFNLATYYGHRFIYIGVCLYLAFKFKQQLDFALTARRRFFFLFRTLLVVYCCGWVLLKISQYYATYSEAMVNGITLTLLVLTLATLLFHYRLTDIFSGKTTQKYKQSPMDTEITKQIVEQLDARLKTELWFLDNSLDQRKVAEKSGFSTQQLSQALNSQGLTFNEFINGYRIEHLKLALQQPDNDDKDVLQLAFDSGFNSKATFYRVFKENTGMTPSQFRDL